MIKSANIKFAFFLLIYFKEAWGGIEPPHRDFADLCLTTWLPGLFVKIKNHFLFVTSS